MMIKKDLNSCSNLRGLTLLEVLLSLAILIVVLLSLISFSQKVKQRNMTALAKTQINALLNAAVQYHTTYAQWPKSLTALMPLLTGNATANPAFCSPWFTAASCAPYTISTNTTYFAIKVTTPSTRYAQDLVTALPNAYIDSDTRTVIAYINAAVQQNNTTPTPLGVLYASDSTYWSGSLTSSMPGYGYCDTASNGPYGIIDVNNAPGYLTPTTSCQVSSTSTTSSVISYKSPNCPNGSAAGMLLLPMGTPFMRNTSLPDNIAFVYLYNYYLPTPGPSTAGKMVNVSNQQLGGLLILSAQDLVCLDPAAMSWAPNATPQ